MIRELLLSVPDSSQLIMLSKTLPDEVIDATGDYMRQPTIIYRNAKVLPIQSIRHLRESTFYLS